MTSGLRPAPPESPASYVGLRMTAEEYFQLPDDLRNLELVDGVVVMSPSPGLRHQAVSMEIVTQLAVYLRTHPVGQVLAETDMNIGKGRRGGDLVYCPEIIFIPADLWARAGQRLREPPALAVEVVSQGSRRYDSETKRHDYERAGILEYWIVDPERQAITLLRLVDGRYQEMAADGDRFASVAVPGFVLEIDRVRALFESLSPPNGSV